MANAHEYSWSGPQRLLARATMIGNAVVMVGCGFLVLTSPLSIPFTVGFWLVGAIIATLAIFTPLPD